MILWGIFVCYLIFNIILLVKHEPWRDEANVWLMAKNLSPLELLQEIKYQGHPCLWYFLVMPLAKAGLPFRSMEVLSLIVMGSAAWILLAKAPFKWWLKIIMIFSPIFTYFNSCIARNYCLIILLMMLIAWLYPMRNERIMTYGLLLGLLVQADTIAIPIAGILSFGWFVESVCQIAGKEKAKGFQIWYKGLSFPLLSLIFWMLQMQGVSGSNQYHGIRLGISECISEVRNFTYVILMRLTGWNQAGCKVFFIFCLLFMLLAVLYRKQIVPSVTLVGTFLFMAAFSACIYQLHIWHFLVLGAVFVAVFWMLSEQLPLESGMHPIVGKISNVLGYTILIVFCAGLIVHWTSEEEPSSLQKAWNGLYSDAGNAAAFLKKETESTDLIIDTDIAMASTVLCYLPEYTFYYAGTGKPADYADWTPAQSGEISYRELIEWVKDTYPDKTIFYLIDTTASCLTDTTGLDAAQLLYETKENTVRNENYRIYRILVE